MVSPSNISTALQHQRSGQPDQAERIYRQVLQQQPDSVDALNLLGALVYKRGSFAEAIACFEKVLSLRPDDPAAYNSLGVVLKGQGNLQAALEYYQQALARDSQQPEILNNLGNIWRELGDPEQAIAAYQQAIAVRPDYAEAYNSLGATERERGDLKAAIAAYQQAIALKPDYAEAYHNLGSALQRQDQPAEAVLQYQQAIALKPDYAEAHNGLGNALQQQQQFESAVPHHQQAIALKPDFPEAHHGLANALHQMGQSADSLPHYDRAIALRPNYAEAHNNLGNALQETGRLDAAIDHYRRAITLRANFVEAHSNLGAALKDQGQLDAAIVQFHAALELNPDYAEVHNNLGNALQEQGKIEAAIACYQKALQLKPGFAEIHSNLGNMLQQVGQFEAAFEQFRAAIAAQPDYPGAYNNLGIAHRNCGQLTEAFAAYEQAIDQARRKADPQQLEFVEAHWNKALTQLLVGDLAQGFAGYEWRFQWNKFKEQNPDRPYTQPRWDGSPLEGKTIFLYAEQGMGDTIQFVRYAAIAAERGGRVILEAQAAIVPLMQTIAAIQQVIPAGNPPPAFNVHAPLMSLPYILGTTLDTVPADVPYLGENLPEDLILPNSKLKTQNSKLKIGFVWNGNPKNPYNRTRTVPLELLLTLAELPNVQLYSLQKELQPGDSEQLYAHPEVIDLHDRLTDFVDTAALIQQLDLVISVDTAVAHLAGALGKPVWLLLPIAPDWRWMLERSDSPWYPTMQIFRQPTFGDWNSVMEGVRSALQALPTLKLNPQNVPLKTSATPATQNSKLKTQNFAADLKIAVQLYETGHLRDAETLCHQLLSQYPDKSQLWHLLGLIAHQEGRRDEAIAHYRSVLERNPRNHDVYNNLGVALQEQQDIDGALSYYEQAIALKPDYADAHNNYANAQREKGRLDIAVQHYERAIACNPTYADAYNNLGLALYAQANYPEAAAAYQQAVTLRPDFAQAHNHLGNALKELGQFEDAVQHYERAIALKPDYAKAFNNWGNVFRDSGDLATAAQYYDRATELEPNFAEAHWNQALTLLLGGDLARGFAEYEWRWQVKLPTFQPLRSLPQPRWDCSPLNGKTIFLHVEQGMGDVIQFVRYAAIVAQMGGRVILEAHPPLISLFRHLPYVQQLIPYGSPPPACDVQAPLLSLPHILGISPATVPANVPYLHCEELLTSSSTQNSKLKTQNSKLKIGLVWSGNPDNPYNRTRAVPLEQLLTLALPNVQLYSLQKDPTAADHALLQAHPEVIDLRDRLTDFVQTAALIQQLDLVISVDTAVTHLTGALAKPVWLLLPFAPDWRWMLERSDSPWYPTMQIFRQPDRGNWNSVIEEVRSALQNLSTSQLKTQNSKLKTQNSPQLIPHPSSRILQTLLSTALQQYDRGNLSETEQLCRQILQQQPDHVEALHTLGVTLCRLERSAEAETYLRRVVEVQPQHAEAWGNLGGAVQQQGQVEAAIAHYQQAIVLNPQFVDAYQNLSVALQSLDRLEEAIAQSQRVIDLKPDLPEIYYSQGFMLRRLNRLEEAIARYRQAIHLKPDFVAAHKNLGHALLLAGQFREGFAEYEWRWQQPAWTRSFPQPRWDGSPLNGETILLHAEQGIGDTLQFVRYAPLVAARGGRVVVECQAGLMQLLETVAGIELLPQDSPLPDFDLHAPLLSLPHLFGTTLDTVPADVPYLDCPPDRTSEFNPQPSKLNIGIVWGGNPEHQNNRYRSCGLAALRSLIELPDCQFYSLQKGEAAAELQQHSELAIVDWSNRLTDFADTAAAIAALDLVITVDTAVAHLAGALGKPVWVLLCFSPDWRWMLDRPDSPWYPTARLFRQPNPGDWNSVIEGVRSALANPNALTPVLSPTRGNRTPDRLPPAEEVRAEPQTPTLKLKTQPLKLKTPIAIAAPFDLITDWGILAVNLAIQLQSHCQLIGVSLEPEALTPFYAALLRSPESSDRPRVVLQALDDNPDSPTVQGDRTIGLFCSTDLSETTIARARDCDRLVTFSTWNAEILKQHGLESQIILPGIDRSLFHPAPNAKQFGDRFVLFSGGTRLQANGQDITIVAFQAFQSRHPDALLLTAWNTIAPDTIALDIPGCIHLGQVPYPLLAQVLRSASVAVFANRCSPSSDRLALDALACGVPTILSANTGHLDLIRHNLGYALQFQRPIAAHPGWGESDVEELLEVMERIYANPQEAAQRGTIAADFLQDWGWERQIQPLLDLIRRV